MQTYRMSFPSWPYIKHFGAIDHFTLCMSLVIFLGDFGFYTYAYLAYLFSLGKETDFCCIFFP